MALASFSCEFQHFMRLFKEGKIPEPLYKHLSEKQIQEIP
jgi:hypothetical protein